MGALKGKPKSLEHRKALSFAQKGRHYSPATEFKKGQCAGEKNPFYGKHHSQENKQRLSQLYKGKHHSPSTEFTSERVTAPEFGERKIRGLREIMNQPEYRGKRREISARLCQDPTYIAKISHNKEMRQHLSKLQRKRMKNPAIRQLLSEMTKKQMADPKIREHLSQLAKQRVKDPEYMRKILSSRRPTGIEQAIIDIIERYGLPYRYTGNGTFQIGGKYPDFVNTDGRKVAVDIFGDHWHHPGEIPERQAIFAEYGWKLIVIWGHEVKELSESELLSKMRN